MTIQAPHDPSAPDEPRPHETPQAQPETAPPPSAMPVPEAGQTPSQVSAPNHPPTQAMPHTQLVPQPISYQSQPAVAPRNGVALTAMILGIVGASVGFWAVVPVTGYLSAALGFPLALAAVICGHIGRSRAKRVGGVGRIQALVGFLLGYASIAFMVVASAAWTVFLFVGAA